MNIFTLTNEQEKYIKAPIGGHLFIEGPAGTGKTTIGVNRLSHLITEGVQPERILVLVPQRILAGPYYHALRQPNLPAGGTTSVRTIGGLARWMINIFWPIISENAGFTHPNLHPTFLTLETAQYYLARIVKPLLEQGYFESVIIDRNRLLSQILDNLNKAAVVGFPHTIIGERLKAAWIGEPSQNRIYEEAQECANQFRRYCLENNILDFSLQLDIFTNHLWPSPICQEFLFGRFHHLIFDNVEEDVPVTHDIVKQWLPKFESALLIYDTDGGYRSFLGADPQSGYTLKRECEECANLCNSWVNSPLMESLRASFTTSLLRKETVISTDLHKVLNISNHQFYPQMIEWVSQQIAELIHEQKVSPGEILILAPFLSDSLRFSLINRLEHFRVTSYSHRPSRSLRDEPATQCLLTLVKLAHPDWDFHCSRNDLRYALMQSISGMDLIRADLLARIVFQSSQSKKVFSSFDVIQPEMQERITYTIGEQFEILRRWLSEYMADQPTELDIFISRLFGEVLSQPGFGFHQNYDAAAVTARLVESIKKFRQVTEESLKDKNLPVGQEYIQMVEEGVIAAQYLKSWSEQPKNAVQLSPAYTFLISNRPVCYQFWLDIGSFAWWERLYQPLTHPYVLSRQWSYQTVWTDANEFQANQEALSRLVSGLIRRCKKEIFLCTCNINEHGTEHRGPLLQATQYLIRRIETPQEVSNV